MQARKTATISLYHAYGTGKLVASISHRGKVQKKIVCDAQANSFLDVIDKAKRWALDNGFSRAVVI